MGKHNINGGASKDGNVVKARVHKKEIFEEGTSAPEIDVITFETDDDETFELELRPEEPFEVVTVYDVPSNVTVTEFKDGSITGKKLTFTSRVNVILGAEAQLASGGLAPDEGESAAARSPDGDGDDPPSGLPIRIRVVVVHPNGLPVTSDAAMPAGPRAARPLDESLR
jgi:hypothetical protein